MRTSFTAPGLCAIILLLPACAAVKTTGKIAAMPVKATYVAGKYGAKGAVMAGKGTVTVVKAPFVVAGAVIDTTEQVVGIAKDASDVSKEVRAYADMLTPRMDIDTGHGTLQYRGNRLSFKRDEIEKVKDAVGDVTDAADMIEMVDDAM